MKSPVFCAIDMPDQGEAVVLANKVRPHVGGLKLGLEFFCANGPQGVREMQKLGLPIFLDLKLHDIPNTVAGAVRSAAQLNVQFLTIHTSGGPGMMEAAAAAAQGSSVKILGVTVLTSLDDADLAAVGQERPAHQQVERLALLGKEAGLEGLVCSPVEVAELRKKLGSDFTLVVPGIRPAEAAAGDQKRVMTPALAMQAGATYLVIGRPITGAADPAEAARTIAVLLAGIATAA